jgi:hypothetical protein
MNIKKSISIITILVFSFIFCITCTRNLAIAEECVGDECTVDGDAAVRGSDYYETQTTTDAYGGTILTGQFGPDVGIGEQGTVYQYTDPRTGTQISYSTSAMGSGLGGIMAGYNGMYSPNALASYGMFANGNKPTAQPTLGYNTQQYQSGNIFGQNTQYSQATPNPYATTALSMMQNPQTSSLGMGLFSLGMYSSPGVSSLAGGSPASVLGGIGVNPYQSAYTANPYQSAYTANPYQSAYTANPYQSAYTANPYQSAYTANPYQSAYTANPYQAAYTANPYQSAYTTNPYQSAYTANPYQSAYTTNPYQAQQSYLPRYF